MEEEEDPSPFHMTAYFDKALDSLFNQYLIATLSNPQNKSQRLPGLPSKNGDKEDQEISIDLLHKLTPQNVFTWNMKKMTSIIQHGAFSTLDEHIQESTYWVESTKIRSENESENAIKNISECC
ncbi:hypothetical protein SLEP1_g4701 [Rubroshorea leprosula]|uniref:Uncharacterized protein n=1 Tax=Rubroshorea leprosula TaxID=152421 RepID=A0AAV5HVY3_9ROSI|nr:hypothetical protein SLEP1_g4701 [Rubroshorea leprosula]